MFDTFFAHTGEDHDSTAESVFHHLESAPFAIFVWILIATTLLLIFINIFKMKRPERLLGLAAFNLAYGVFLYDKSPVVGAIVLSTGFGMTLWSVIIGLQDDKTDDETSSNKKGE